MGTDERPRAPSWPDARRGAQVLVVIEAEPLAGLVATLLRLDGYRVCVVHRLDATPGRGRPDLVLVDVVDRVELPCLPARLDGLPVVALTSVPVELVEAHEPSAGGTSWLGKPFSPVALLERVASLLDPEAGTSTQTAP